MILGHFFDQEADEKAMNKHTICMKRLPGVGNGRELVYPKQGGHRKATFATQKAPTRLETLNNYGFPTVSDLEQKFRCFLQTNDLRK